MVAVLAQIASSEQALSTARLGLPTPWLLERVGVQRASLPLLGVLHALRVSINWRATRAAAHRAYEADLYAHFLDTSRLAGRTPDLDEAKMYARSHAQENSRWTPQRDLAGLLAMVRSPAFLHCTAPYRPLWIEHRRIIARHACPKTNG